MRFLFRMAVVLALLVAIGTYWLGYWSFDQLWAHSWRATAPSVSGPASAGSGRVLIGQLKGEAGKAAATAEHFVSDAELTAKIRSKMALDDTVQARTIDVSTTGGVVTLTGTVGSAPEHAQALRLARDTKGVKRVVDHLKLR
jgi:hyperosmotically inducible periplasmic protein